LLYCDLSSASYHKDYVCFCENLMLAYFNRWRKANVVEMSLKLLLFSKKCVKVQKNKKIGTVIATFIIF
jgi:hypothetical protein